MMFISRTTRALINYKSNNHTEKHHPHTFDIPTQPARILPIYHQPIEFSTIFLLTVLILRNHMCIHYRLRLPLRALCELIPSTQLWGDALRLLLHLWRAKKIRCKFWNFYLYAKDYNFYGKYNAWRNDEANVYRMRTLTIYAKILSFSCEQWEWP